MATSNQLAQKGRNLAKDDPIVGVVRTLVPSDERGWFDIATATLALGFQPTTAWTNVGERFAVALHKGRKLPEPPQLTSVKTLAGYYVASGADAEDRVMVWRRLRRDGAMWVGAKLAIDRVGITILPSNPTTISNDCGTATASFGGESNPHFGFGKDTSFGSELGYGGFARFGADTPYQASLRAVGLTPDQPDAMWANIVAFLTQPQAFKNKDPNWPGTRDDLSWWQDSPTHVTLQWPFGGGSWLDAKPKNDAQIRAVFRIPSGVSTAQGLSSLYSHAGHPGFPTNMAYGFNSGGWSGGGGFDLIKSVGDGLNTVVNVANDLNIPGVNLTTAILTGKDPVAAFKADIDHFKSAAGIAAAVASGNTGQLTASLNATAGQFGVHLSPSDVAAATAAAQGGADPSTIAATAMGGGYTKAWQVTTNDGAIFDPSLPAPPGQSYKPGAVPASQVTEHPLTAAAKKSVPLHIAVAQTPITVAHDQNAVSLKVVISKWWPTALGIAVGGAAGAVKHIASWAVAGALGGGIGGFLLGETRKGKK